MQNNRGGSMPPWGTPAEIVGVKQFSYGGWKIKGNEGCQLAKQHLKFNWVKRIGKMKNE